LSIALGEAVQLRSAERWPPPDLVQRRPVQHVVEPADRLRVARVTGMELLHPAA
jgi:hypothetical protein